MRTSCPPPYLPPFRLRVPSARSTHERIVPSKPNAWPLWTTKSLYHGLRPFEVQRSSTVHPPAPRAACTRRVPLCSSAAIRMSPPGTSDGCTIGYPDHACCQSSVPSAGVTLVKPVPLMCSTCGTPSIVVSCGELYP